MKELIEILDAILSFAAKGERLALATIVGVRGSTYRRAGARLLLTASQQMVGNISGGCLESDVMVVAEGVMASGTPRLVTYDLTADDDAVWGLGLGCNGAVDVFVEPVDPASPLFPMLRHVLAEEQTISLVKVVNGPPQAGAWMVVDANSRRTGTLGDPEVNERAARAAATVQGEGGSRLLTLPASGGEARVFIEVIRPPIRLVICGAGHDAIPLVQFAAALGWRVIVVDARERFLTHDRFPGASRFIKADPVEAASQAPIDARTYVVVMTHNYLHDRDLLRGFLSTGAGYLGMLGPRIRTQKILDDLRRDGVTILDDVLVRVFGPIGLDIGSEGPEEIALAVLGEIQAVESGRRGGFLRERPGPIHQTEKPVAR